MSYKTSNSHIDDPNERRLRKAIDRLSKARREIGAAEDNYLTAFAKAPADVRQRVGDDLGVELNASSHQTIGT